MKQKFRWQMRGLMAAFGLLLLFVAEASFAQTRVISGTVADKQTSDPLPGVSVRVKSSGRGISTGGNGGFRIEVSDSDVLVFSYLGYQKKEVPVKGVTTVNVLLEVEASALKEIVVIGYGEVNKRDNTGSVGSVNMNDFSKPAVRSFDEALAGRIAGVQVSSADGQPGSSGNIVIRGGNSLTQDNSPLYVVDGFPLEDPSSNVLQPSEIESLEILKDASATAIYGARGANGVVLITTKKGVKGKPSITYNGYYGIQQNPNTIELMDPYEFVKLQDQIDPIKTAEIYFTEGRTLESYRTAQSYDFQGALFQTAPMQNHNISLRGGSDRTLYNISLSSMEQDGVIINSGFKRYQGRLALDQNVNDRVKVGTNLTFTNFKTAGAPPSENSFSNMNYLMYSVWAYRPVTSGNINLMDDLFDAAIDRTNDYRINPIVNAQNEVRDNSTDNMIANIYGEYNLTKDLKLRVTGGMNASNRTAYTFNNSRTRGGNPNSLNKVNGSIINFRTNTWLNENTLTYRKTINADHSVNAVAGYTMQGSKSRAFGASAVNLPNEALDLSGMDEGTPSIINSTSSDWTMASFLGRVNYGYKNRYLATVSFRSDGSSKFAKGNQWGYFPSASLAWKLQEENFMKKIPAVSEAKVRASWGVTGNNRVGDFSTYSSLAFPVAAGYAFNNVVERGIYPQSLSNTDLKWETTAQTDIGLDLGVLNNRVLLTADLYRKNTTDLLLNAQLPASTGYANAFKNIGKIRNEGVELTLSTVNVDNSDFKWNSSFNIAFNRSKVLGLTQNQQTMLSSVSWDQNWNTLSPYIARIGEPVAQMFGYVWEGVYQYEDFDMTPSGGYVLKDNVATNGSSRSTIRPGDIKYRDLNGDKVVDDNDRTVIGRATPIHFGGFSNNFDYKGFDLNVFLQWSYGNDILNANRLLLEGTQFYNVNQFATYENRWTPENTNTTIHRMGGKGPNAYSSRVIEDGSFLRLKTVSLGYNVPAKLLKKGNISGMRIYASAQNLHTWSNYSGYDPEVSVRNSALTPGFDFSAYPRARTIVFGASVSL